MTGCCLIMLLCNVMVFMSLGIITSIKSLLTQFNQNSLDGLQNFIAGLVSYKLLFTYFLGRKYVSSICSEIEEIISNGWQQFYLSVTNFLIWSIQFHELMHKKWSYDGNFYLQRIRNCLFTKYFLVKYATPFSWLFGVSAGSSTRSKT